MPHDLERPAFLLMFAFADFISLSSVTSRYGNEDASRDATERLDVR